MLLKTASANGQTGSKHTCHYRSGPKLKKKYWKEFLEDYIALGTIRNSLF